MAGLEEQAGKNPNEQENREDAARQQSLAAPSCKVSDHQAIQTKPTEPAHVKPSTSTEQTIRIMTTKHPFPRDMDKPLHLLGLPSDILNEIIKEITHTNDLTSLALTHSALHALATPVIYSRFDIVWPDAHAATDTRVGVDALTYGLATLVMAQDVFGETQTTADSSTCRNIRRGNNFAQYTRKFSLGNGPADWVQEYLITKEGGKMLGTLVALAVGRMTNLEAFIWDMPTGILRDVWLALASLAVRNGSRGCSLERIWVRWHDNSEAPPQGTINASHHQANPTLISSTGQQPFFQIPPYPRVEHPTFSILPPLRSLTVLDIDELPYVEELSILLEKSIEKLRELRIGVAQHAQFDSWIQTRETRVYPSGSDPTSHGGINNPAGLLGLLTSRFCDISSLHADAKEQAAPATPSPASASTAVANLTEDFQKQTLHTSDENIRPEALQEVAPMPEDPLRKASLTIPALRRKSDTEYNYPQQARRLLLDTLELERVPLHVTVLMRAIDWTRIKTLTLLGCRNHETLWKIMRRRFGPPSHARTPSRGSERFSLTPRPSVPAFDYPLHIKHLHTDTVTPALICFLKDALAPDSLEWLFLQETRPHRSTVLIDSILRVLRRHRNSLKKLLIDSEDKNEDPAQGPVTSWRKWLVNREVLAFITSGKMLKLRELSMVIDYKDWHYLLQRLPQATKLRSLHIANIADHIQGRADPRELALQVLDIVALRPELELCYLGIHSKCFEILELDADRNVPVSGAIPVMQQHPTQGHVDSEEEDDDDQDDGDDGGDTDLSDSDQNDMTDDEQHNTEPKKQFKLREILFYDDKVSIFKARHGRL